MALLSSQQLGAWLLGIGIPEAVASAFEEGGVDGQDVGASVDTGDDR